MFKWIKDLFTPTVEPVRLVRKPLAQDALGRVIAIELIKGPNTSQGDVFTFVAASFAGDLGGHMGAKEGAAIHQQQTTDFLEVGSPDAPPEIYPPAWW
jgi:hypothetical protein